MGVPNVRLDRERMFTIAQKRLSGKTFTEIGKEHCITGSRCRQIFDKALRIISIGLTRDSNYATPETFYHGEEHSYMNHCVQSPKNFYNILLHEVEYDYNHIKQIYVSVSDREEFDRNKDFWLRQIESALEEIKIKPVKIKPIIT